jgi:hypothetical protein
MINQYDNIEKSARLWARYGKRVDARNSAYLERQRGGFLNIVHAFRFT